MYFSKDLGISNFHASVFHRVCCLLYFELSSLNGRWEKRTSAFERSLILLPTNQSQEWEDFLVHKVKVNFRKIVLVSQIAWNWILTVESCLMHSSFFTSPNEQCSRHCQPVKHHITLLGFFDSVQNGRVYLLSTAPLGCRFHEGGTLFILLTAIGPVPSWALSI